MALQKFLQEQRANLVERWGRQVLEGYSVDAARIFGRQKDRFANPIGYTVNRGLDELLGCLLSESDRPDSGVEEMIKVRAVQELPPSVAVGFVFQLPPLVRAMLATEKVTVAEKELAWLVEAVEQMALDLFDTYMQCRERLSQVRIREIKANRFLLTDHARCPSKFLKEEGPAEEAAG